MMMRLAILGVLLAASVPRQDDPGRCDLKTVQEQLVCPRCAAVLEKEMLDQDGKCRTCQAVAEKSEVCVKTYYYAACCKTKHAADGECCGRSFVRKVSKARVVHACRTCGSEGRAGTACRNARCKDKGRALERSCSRNGEFPHGGEP